MARRDRDLGRELPRAAFVSHHHHADKSRAANACQSPGHDLFGVRRLLRRRAAVTNASHYLSCFVLACPLGFLRRGRLRHDSCTNTRYEIPSRPLLTR